MPKHIGCNGSRDGQTDSKLSDHELCFAGVSGKGIENALNPQIVAGVQQHSSPRATAFQTQPGKWEADTHNHDRKARQSVPSRRSGVVISK